jgi:GAF domain-containing protein
VSECLRSVDREPESVLDRIVNLLPAGFRDPERTGACLIVGGRRYCSRGFRPSDHAQVAPIRVSRRHAGTVQVHVRPRRGRSEEPVFLPEERTLLETVAALLGNALGLRADAMRG